MSDVVVAAELTQRIGNALIGGRFLVLNPVNFSLTTNQNGDSGITTNSCSLILQIDFFDGLCQYLEQGTNEYYYFKRGGFFVWWCVAGINEARTRNLKIIPLNVAGFST